VCEDAGVSFPAVYRACATDADCTEEDLIDCCTTLVLGVAKAETDAGNPYRVACLPSGPACPCSINSIKIVTDDGKSSPQGTTTMLACKAGLCSTYVP
jgi:hypothetical protein